MKKFKHKCYSNGSSQSLDYFYLNITKKDKFLKMIMFIIVTARNNLIKWEYLGKMVKKECCNYFNAIFRYWIETSRYGKNY